MSTGFPDLHFQLVGCPPFGVSQVPKQDLDLARTGCYGILPGFVLYQGDNLGYPRYYDVIISTISLFVNVLGRYFRYMRVTFSDICPVFLKEYVPESITV